MSSNPDEFAKSVVLRFAPEFGLQASSQNFSEAKKSQASSDHIITHFQQKHNGVPVLGGEIIVNTNQHGDLFSVSGEVSPNPTVQTQPTIDSAQAANFALSAIAKWYEMDMTNFHATDPELWIYDEGLLKPSNRPVELVWRMEISAGDESLPIRELVLVNADTGNISLHFNQVDTFWHVSNGYKSSQTSTKAENINTVVGSSQVNTYTANNGTSLPGTLLCNQNQPNCTNGSNPHADAAHKYALGTYNIYAANHSRDSINNAGMTIKSTVHYSSGYANAFWNGSQMVYGDGAGFPLADDVVAHELTHGVTQYESDLFYYYQSGAINESFSDVWGEYYDQTNGLGTDTPSVKWLLGEDISGYGAIRSMNNPPAYSDPDKMSSSNYYLGTGDNGGVHTNSGLNNKAVSLMVDGGSFNGKTVTALGWTKVEQIYYEVQANLLVSGADYSDLYYALQQACSDFIGQYGITSNDCIEVKDAADAVEMNGQPIADFNRDAPYCDSPSALIVDTFSDDLETGSSNWTFTNGAYTRWQYEDPPFGKYTHSGVHALYANDDPGVTTDAQAKLLSIEIPSNAYLHFAHAYDFETSTGKYWDGGVIEYSTNNGSTWIDAGSLMEYNGYDNTIWQTANNPLANRPAFVGVSNGYISTRLNLSSLAGQTVAFRWRMGLDQSVSSGGWFVDDIQIYQCATQTKTPLVQNIISPNSRSNLGSNVGFTVIFSEPVTGVDASDFQLLSPGLTGTSITGVSGSNDTYTVSVNTGNGKGTLHLNVIDNDSIINQSGIPLGGAGINNGDFLGANTIPVVIHSSGASSSSTIISKSSSDFEKTQNNIIKNTEPSFDNEINAIIPKNPADEELLTSAEGDQPTSPPSRTSPVENAILTSTPIFHWMGKDTFTQYQFQLSTSKDFSVILVSTNIDTNYFTPDQMGYESYFWRIRGVGQSGKWSEWSHVYMVTITNKLYNSIAENH